MSEEWDSEGVVPVFREPAWWLAEGYKSTQPRRQEQWSHERNATIRASTVLVVHHQHWGCMGRFFDYPSGGGRLRRNMDTMLAAHGLRAVRLDTYHSGIVPAFSPQPPPQPQDRA